MRLDEILFCHNCRALPRPHTLHTLISFQPSPSPTIHTTQPPNTTSQYPTPYNPHVPTRSPPNMIARIALYPLHSLHTLCVCDLTEDDVFIVAPGGGGGGYEELEWYDGECGEGGGSMWWQKVPRAVRGSSSQCLSMFPYFIRALCSRTLYIDCSVDSVVVH